MAWGRGIWSSDASMEQNRSEQPVEAAFGFLTAVDAPSHGLFGGYLLVDLAGRPLEFHCTAPVKVSRAQQILYGATLQSHLHGRQIGATLLAEGTVAPEVVLTDLESMLHVRSYTNLPVALVAGTAPAGAASTHIRPRPATAARTRMMLSIAVRRQTIASRCHRRDT